MEFRRDSVFDSLYCLEGCRRTIFPAMTVSRHWHLALKVLAELRKVTPAALSERSGVHPNTVRRYLREPVNFEIETLEKLLAGLDVTILDLAMVMTRLRTIDQDASLSLFEVEETGAAVGGAELPPEIFRLAAEVKWLHQEMQRLLNEAHPIRPRGFHV